MIIKIDRVEIYLIN